MGCNSVIAVSYVVGLAPIFANLVCAAFAFAGWHLLANSPEYENQVGNKLKFEEVL